MFENIDYNDVNKFTMQYDPKFKSADTIRLKERIVDLIIDGYSTATIADSLGKELNFKAMYAKALCSKAYKDYMGLVHKGSDDIVEKNISRLNRIYRQAMEANDRKSAIQAIDLLNKMKSAYVNKVEVSTNEFEIKLNEE